MLKRLVSKQSVGKKSQKSITIALNWLKQQDIELKYRPTVVHSGMECPFNADACASVNSEDDYVVSAFSHKLYFELEAMYGRFGLTLSRKVCDAISEKASGLLSTFQRSKGLEADITLYNPVAQHLKELDEIMVHEMWHLVERQEGIKDGSEIIGEGTATIVQYRFAGKRCFLQERENTYETIAAIIQHQFNGCEIPLSDLLKPSLRKKINQAAEAFTGSSERLRDEAIERVKSPEYIELQRQSILAHPAWASFRKNPTPKTYLEGLRAIGDEVIADELEGQNLKRLVKYGAGLITK